MSSEISFFLCTFAYEMSTNYIFLHEKNYCFRCFCSPRNSQFLRRRTDDQHKLSHCLRPYDGSRRIY